VEVDPYPTLSSSSGRRSEEQKRQLADEIAKNVVAIAGCEGKSVSVAFEEVAPEDWAEKVYRPDILGKSETMYKRPGYVPVETDG
jgi:4-oxalocrotonate tautomerase